MSVSHLYQEFPQLKPLKEQAEQSMRDGNFAAAFMHWSQAITAIKPRVEASLHAQRSKCFAQLGQYYLAMEDADVLIKETPDAIQGYLRKAEIYFATCHFEEAHQSYLKCFSLSNNKFDKELYMDQAKKCKRELSRQGSLTRQYPWVGAALGIVLAIMAILLQLATSGEAEFSYPFVKVGLGMTAAVAGFYFARLLRRQALKYKEGMLENPDNLFRT